MPSETIPFSIVRTHHAELWVTDLERSREFYVDLLGFVETERTKDALYLRGLEERSHHSLVLRKAPTRGCGHIGFKVSRPEDLDALHTFFAERGCPVVRLPRGAEPGHGSSLLVQDPLGFPVEFLCATDPAPRQLQKFDQYRGAFPMRIDHVNLFVPDVQVGHDYYTKSLGFRLSEYTETETEPRRIWASWLHRKDNVHDVALMNGAGPRLHHVGFWVLDTASVLRACDILAASGYHASLERGPGRHGLSNAFFLYVRDPDQHRIELYTGDYLTADPDFEPIRWSINDPRRGTFWGHQAPASWFEEATPVASIETGELIEPKTALLKERPDFVT